MRYSVGKGDAVLHQEYNEFLRLVRASKQAATKFGAQSIDEQGVTAWIKNTTASKVPAFGVLAIDAPIIAPDTDSSSTATVGFRSRIAFNGIAPSTSVPHYGKFAVLQEPCPAGFMVPAVIAGITHCKLNINDADDCAAEITNGQTSYLNSQQHGSARILWKESGTGTDKWATVLVGSWVGAMLGKTDAAIAKGASGTVSIWSGVEGSEADTGVNVTAYNRFANVAITKWVLVVSIQGRLYLAAAEC